MEHGTEELCALLGNRTRFTILKALNDGPKDVGSLAAACWLSDSAVSQALHKMRLAGLVQSETKAQQRIYRIREEPAVPWLVRAALAYDAGEAFRADALCSGPRR